MTQELTVRYEISEIAKAAVVTVVLGGPLVLVAVGLWPTAPAVWTGPLVTAVLPIGLVIAVRWNNVKTRIVHHRNPDLESPRRASTPSWTPLVVVVVILVAAQVTLNSLVGHLGDVAVAITVGAWVAWTTLGER